MPRKIKKVYWDSSIVIAWLKNEKRPNHEMDGVYDCVERIKKGNEIMVTSSETQLEVLEAEMDKKTEEKYINLFKRRQCQILPYDIRVQTLAKEIREYYQRQHIGKGTPSIGTEDAKHLASAIHYKVDEFYTFDEGKKGKLGLLSLSGNVAGYQLKICKPPVGQMRLEL